MDRSREVNFNLETTQEFVKECATTFGWGDLSEDTVMDLGCGTELNCAKTVLEDFPNVKSIIALDGCPTTLQEISFKSPRITNFLANILKRSDIHQYEGKVDKVISTHVLHQIINKEKALENVYCLLKLGGEAAFLFTMDYALYHVLEILRRDPRFEDYFKISDLYTLYSSKFKADNYREMLQKIGFQVVKMEEDKYYFPKGQFGQFETVSLYDNVLEAFSVPEELVPVIKESAAHVFRTKFYHHKSFYLRTEMSIFVTKPCESDTAFCSS